MRGMAVTSCKVMASVTMVASPASIKAPSGLAHRNTVTANALQHRPTNSATAMITTIMLNYSESY